MGAQAQEKTYYFESRYPALQLHLAEKVTQLDAERKVRSLDAVEFAPEVGLATGSSPKKGFFSTKNERLVEVLRKHKNFGKTFTEISKA